MTAIARLLAEVKSGGDPTREVRDHVEALVVTAPPEVAELVREMDRREWTNVDLGWRSVETRALAALADTWAQVVDDFDVDEPRGEALAQSVQIGSSGGGEVYFGLCWTERGVHGVEVDFDEGMLRWYDTPEELFAWFVDIEVQRGDPMPGPLARIAGLPDAPAPGPAKPPPAVRRVDAPPPHPFEAAIAHFGTPRYVQAHGPTPRGRLLLTRRLLAGSPPTPAKLVVREPEGSTRQLPWDGQVDI